MVHAACAEAITTLRTAPCILLVAITSDRANAVFDIPLYYYAAVCLYHAAVCLYYADVCLYYACSQCTQTYSSHSQGHGRAPPYEEVVFSQHIPPSACIGCRVHNAHAPGWAVFPVQYRLREVSLAGTALKAKRVEPGTAWPKNSTS